MPIHVREAVGRDVVPCRGPAKLSTTTRAQRLAPLGIINSSKQRRHLGPLPHYIIPKKQAPGSCGYEQIRHPFYIRPGRQHPGVDGPIHHPDALQLICLLRDISPGVLDVGTAVNQRPSMGWLRLTIHYTVGWGQGLR